MRDSSTSTSSTAQRVKVARQVLIARLKKRSGDVGHILAGRPTESQRENEDKK